MTDEGINTVTVLTSKLKIFDSCKNLIRCLPLLEHDKNDPEDASDTPHEVTHSPEEVRYAVMSRPPISKDDKFSFPDDMSLSEQSAVLNNIAFEKEYEKLQEHIVGF